MRIEAADGLPVPGAPGAGEVTRVLGGAAGELIERGEGDFVLSRPVEIPSGCKPTDIIGRGGSRTRIRAQAGAFHARSPLNLERLSLWRADWPIERPAIGVFAEASVLLERV